MGLQDVKKADAEQLRDFMKLLLRDVRAMEQMLEDGSFETGIRRIGAEQELFLVDKAFKPATRSLEILQAIDDERFTTELGRFNIEYNLDPMVLGGSCLGDLETQLELLLEMARVKAEELGMQIAMTGILPTLGLADLSIENMTPYPRYYALNEALCRQAGGAYKFHIKGADEFRVEHDNVMLESANTSFQVHFQVGPEEFATLYNVAQLCAAPVLAVATNSPMLFGKRLWHETRIALFQQSIDTRSGAHMRERLPRVSFGSDWIDNSVLEIFREDITRFRLLIHTDVDEDPFEVLARGEAPSLKALRLHNGTVYRWNRACYGIMNGKPHLRIENRVLPAGPTTRDEVANAAFWFGLMTGVSEAVADVRDVMDFDDAKTNFLGAARLGLGTSFRWIDGKSYPAQDLIVNALVPMARDALKGRGLDSGDVDTYLDVIEERVKSGKTPSTWILDSFQGMNKKRALSERLSALTAATIRRQVEGKPGHTWERAEVGEGAQWKDDFSHVGQFMQTDLFTVDEDELVELVASVMDWQEVRHVPVEDEHDHLVGLVTYRTILKHLTSDETNGESIPVSTIMIREVVTCTPETPTLEVIKMMREQGLSCVPVLQGERLVGMVTEQDFLEIARELLEQGLSE